MHEKTIELELRAEVLLQDYNPVKKSIERLGLLHSHTKRLSVMFFGEVDSKKIDIRVRITDGECEVVIKKGEFGSHDRIETSQNISSTEFLGMVKVFSQFGFIMKVGERDTFNYTLPDGVIISLVSAGPVSYVELEKMSSEDDLEENNKQIKQYADQIGLKLLKSEEDFKLLCDCLNEKSDWFFNGTNEEYSKLGEMLNDYIED